MELVAVAALDEARVIGRDGEVPWHLPADRRQYRERVADHPVILGRRTFEAMLEDLPGSAQVVVSRSAPEYDVSTARVVSSVEGAIEAARDLGADRAYVIGGGAIYDLFLPQVDRLVLSRVPGVHEGDTYFPDFDESEWRLVSDSAEEGFTLQEWERFR